MTDAILKFSAKTKSVRALLDELELLASQLSEDDKAKLSAWLDVIGGNGLVIFDPDQSPTPAGEYVILAKPTDRLLRLVATLRAGKFDASSVDEAHVNPLQDCCAAED